MTLYIFLKIQKFSDKKLKILSLTNQPQGFYALVRVLICFQLSLPHVLRWTFHAFEIPSRLLTKQEINERSIRKTGSYTSLDGLVPSTLEGVLRCHPPL